MTVCVRFAPSPTGLLHVGNLRPALYNALFARRHGGTFILRLDDTDRERSTEAFAEAIVEDLAWIGIMPDRIERQSDRLNRYDAAAERLRGAARLYDAYETADELERRRKRALARHRPPIYDRAALSLDDEERAALRTEGRSPHWRFRLDHQDEAWDDLVRGRQSIDCASLSDPVLVRADGSYLYTLPSVVDDAEMGITHVIRGEDHVANTAAQIQIFRALGAEPPTFGHHNLLTLPDGSGLSKRLGSLSLRALREAGMEPMAVASVAALIGTGHDVEPAADLDALAEMVALDRISRAPAKFEPADLARLNARIVHDMPYGRARDRLSEMGADEGEAFWTLVRDNLETVADAADWAERLRAEGPLAALEGDDLAYVREAWDLMPDGPWDEATWPAWTEAVKSRTGRKGKPLFMPLRLALTGQASGPDLGRWIQLAGPTRISARRP